DAGWRRCRVRLAVVPLEFVGLPAVMHPEPVGRILPHRLFKGLVDVTGDGLDTAGFAVLPGGDLVAQFDPPPAQANALTDRGVQGTGVAQGKNGWRRCGGAVASEERHTH